ncbi:acyl-ACP--UDP-N-acetylglucosamine O-acyltransferase [Engelhardtia mirabilis]|uniref:Acyl-[acyl-carrier-protein]--UDP-N-acetylglucosamine O-acyltransferase n=1 Tax=Engelhardtia mirabilis TaxID=2528011 RepID=A0A518BPI7_9BACT|nr:Acyl-[acyl-carrier-protein]--UDP-N-acetylglucosamine O-acyltransferase [Planctomycetes bacterium Pla133]QDV03212.1 Acyl-[acyl-carrier-protein]--UDP-N-acetylglucosamine O-acyltransferase [Planctomycetes bacterium Pla86]
MSTQVHETAILGEGVELGEEVKIGPYCVIAPGTRIGDRTEIGPQVAIEGLATIGVDNIIGPKVNISGVTVIGDHNVIFGQASLGTAPQDFSYRGEATCLHIGDRNTIREFVTINRGTVKGGGYTRIGSDCLLMACCHVAHDCDLDDHVIMGNNSLLAGHVKVELRANISGAAAAHHFVTIGAYSYVGGMTRMIHDIPPFMIVEGHPSRVRGVNSIGLQRAGIDEANVRALREAFKDIYRATGTRGEALDRLADMSDDPQVLRLVEALRLTATSQRGRYRETLRDEFSRLGRARILGETTAGLGD